MVINFGSSSTFLISFGTCSRQFYVGEDLTQEDIKAAFNDGVLKLIVPKEIKKVEEEPKFITIE